MLRDRWLFGRKAGSFTLQWHLTNACELHCAHCYDRSKRTILDLDEASRVLDDFTGFCDRHRVSGQVCLTGGNPFLYPGFMDVYRAAASAGHAISILGNPVSREQIAKIAEVRRPFYYQVSLEGLPEYNDRIRKSYPKVADTLFELGKYCKERKLEEEARKKLLEEDERRRKEQIAGPVVMQRVEHHPL
ncbi:MAG: radical SAM protein, partial [Nitrospirae bacterium]|nr:radical SAM protein [Nitrospirota bacterium]